MILEHGPDYPVYDYGKPAPRTGWYSHWSIPGGLGGKHYIVIPVSLEEGEQGTPDEETIRIHAYCRAHSPCRDATFRGGVYSFNQGALMKN